MAEGKMECAIAKRRPAGNAVNMSIGDLRQDYRAAELRRADLSPNPFVQFEKWFTEALQCAGIREANAMTLATTGTNGAVMARTVLLKGHDQNGFVFFTNYLSRKGRQLEENPQAALLFPWLPLERQVSISGRVEKTTVVENEAYFASRPLGSKLGAWASAQSEVLPSREPLDARYAELSQQYADGTVPTPAHWGGYRVVPESIEFWQGRTSRLHDRFLYTREADGNWRLERLSP